MITVSSGLAFVPLPITPTYNATKAAIHSFTESLRVQLADTSIQVIELVPPGVRTTLMGQQDSEQAMPLGEPWSPLILRDVFVGITRFDQLQADLGISRKVLTERLKWLVDHDVLARQPYSMHPPREEYVLTGKGRELCDLLLVMAAWGDRWTAGEEGPPVLYRHHDCGQITHAELRCAACAAPMRASDVDALPAAGYMAVGTT
ncbi:SDR family NAD(P)-dependent oxidoreductase [Paenarthrobacter sp. PH39-S1]|nr:SDR family NAD(P)-dependent oxidoreductase [Paenarthrobacter sp. PH39-S1]MDJ0356591.1 SDR family NAD(P)-dependent oxidoreductase [Paenarthrobacter sp. PH39-S1]